MAGLHRQIPASILTHHSSHLATQSVTFEGKEGRIDQDLVGNPPLHTDNSNAAACLFRSLQLGHYWTKTHQKPLGSLLPWIMKLIWELPKFCIGFSVLRFCATGGEETKADPFSKQNKQSQEPPWYILGFLLDFLLLPLLHLYVVFHGAMAEVIDLQGSSDWKSNHVLQ